MFFHFIRVNTDSFVKASMQPTSRNVSYWAMMFPNSRGEKKNSPFLIFRSIVAKIIYFPLNLSVFF